MPTVLIVDDDKHTRGLIRHVFQVEPRLVALGCKLVEADDGATALAAFAQTPADIVITDLLMPGMDGFQLCEAIRNRADGRTAGLVAVSGAYREPSVELRVREQFKGRFLAKPYELRVLADLVVELLGGARAAAPAKAPLPPSPDAVSSGTLAETPLSRVLLDLWERRATGMLELRRAGLEKRIDLVAGHPVAVSSNQRSEALGQLLLARKLITAEQHQAALQRAHDEGDRMGQVLVESGVLTAPQLVAALTAQAGMRIVRSLRWTEGQWRYTPNRDVTRPRGNALETVRAVFAGLKQTGRHEESMTVVRGLGEGRLTLNPRGHKVAAQIGKVFGDTIALALRDGTTVTELLSATSDPTGITRAIEVLSICECLHVTQPAVSDLPASAPRTTAPEPDALPPPPEPAEPIIMIDPLTLSEPEADLPKQAVPQAIDDPEASGVIEISAVSDDEFQRSVRSEASEAQRALLLAEYLRVQGIGSHAVLGVPEGAQRVAIETAYAARVAEYAPERFKAYDLGADHGKIDEVHAAYAHARDELLANRDPSVVAPLPRRLTTPLRGEIAFTRGENALSRGELDDAIAAFEAASAQVPDAADYPASLAWARYRRCIQTAPLDAASARQVIEPALAALAIDPDLGLAHEVLGRVHLDLGRPGEAAGHLERALVVRPPRAAVLPLLESLWQKSGETARLDALYAGLAEQTDDAPLAGRAALALAALRRDQGDLAGARRAASRAAALDPDEPAAPRLLAALDEGHADRWSARAEALRTWWRLDPGDPEPGRALVAGARAAGDHDLAFVASALLTVRDPDAALVEAHYRRERPRFLARAMERPIELATSPSLRAPDDDVALAEAFAALAPLVDAVDPLGANDLRLGQGAALTEARVPAPFARVRAWVAEVLDVQVPEIMVRDDLGGDVHVAALSGRAPTLLVGPRALADDDRLALGFALGRAMTYLWPGRAVAGSRPARRLRAILLAALGGGAPAGETAPLHAAASAKLALVSPGSLGQLRRSLAELAAGRDQLNLSRWLRAMARTADRVGLLLSADPAVALRRAEATSGPEAAAALFAFAVSKEHLDLRDALGRSIAV